MSTREYNFDGLVGPTHNYGGLSWGNVASAKHGGSVSNPKSAALQGILKMRALSDMGLGQAILPPLARPSLRTLRALGFSGRDEDVITRTATDAPGLLRLCSSASSMWTANAATVAPSLDTRDQRVHLTPANLQAMFHRSIEAVETHALLLAIFRDAKHFVVHEPLPGGGQFADEGAANHTRLFTSEHAAVHLFAWGRRAFSSDKHTPSRFPARQTLEASEALARLHALTPSRVVFAQQHPAGIDAGAFHTDVLAVGNASLLLAHSLAFLDLSSLEMALRAALGDSFRLVHVTSEQLPVERAVQTYLFNAQLVSLPDQSMALIAPHECEHDDLVRSLITSWIDDPTIPISQVRYFDLRQSMRNGGGPACLRQRIVLTQDEALALHGRVLFTPSLQLELETWVKKHYRDALSPNDLADPRLARESMTALDELTHILKLGSVYDFQQ